MSLSFEAVRDLIAKKLEEQANEYEQTGIGQFKRSASRTGPGYTAFENARSWGENARVFREAAKFVKGLKA